jgi:hypothetical protein
MMFSSTIAAYPHNFATAYPTRPPAAKPKNVKTA